MEWIQIPGVIFVLWLLIPNMIYAKYHGNFDNHNIAPLWIILEQIGRFGSMFFMCFQVGFGYDGFLNPYMATYSYTWNSVVLILYCYCWTLLKKGGTLPLYLALAILPSILFISSAILSRNYMLLVTSILFAIAHIYITYKNYWR